MLLCNGKDNLKLQQYRIEWRPILSAALMAEDTAPTEVQLKGIYDKVAFLV